MEGRLDTRKRGKYRKTKTNERKNINKEIISLEQEQ
jgi:hypothetical protein